MPHSFFIHCQTHKKRVVALFKLALQYQSFSPCKQKLRNGGRWGEWDGDMEWRRELFTKLHQHIVY